MAICNFCKIKTSELNACAECGEMISFIKNFYLKVQEEFETGEIISTQMNNVFLILRELGIVATQRNPFLSPYTKLVSSLIRETLQKKPEEIDFNTIFRFQKTERDFSELLGPLEKSGIIEVVIHEEPLQRMIKLTPLFYKFVRVLQTSNGEQQEQEQTTRTVLGYIILQMFHDYSRLGIGGSYKRLRTAWIRYQYIFLTIRLGRKSLWGEELNEFLRKRKFNISARIRFLDIFKNINPSSMNRMIKERTLKKKPGLMAGDYEFTFSEDFINGINEIRDYERPIEVERDT